MAETWYAIVVFLLTGYVVLDGFDLGAGTLHLFVARTDPERRQVLSAIGPYWDGNEVWLIAAGGALFVAFPRLLATGISGFYFAIFLVVWSLILRGVSLEFRSHVEDPLWRRSWDFFFAVASALLPFFLGAALGNLLRGVPLTAEGWFELPLFTDFTAREPAGILDWYTILVGAFASAALTAHGAAFLVWKTDGSVRARSRSAARRAFLVVAVLWPIVTLATVRVRPGFLSGLATRPAAAVSAGAALAALVGVFRALARDRDRAAFAASSVFLIGLSVATAACVYPVMLLSSGDASLSLTVEEAAADARGLRTAFVWLLLALPPAILWFTIVWRTHRGKVGAAAEGGY